MYILSHASDAANLPVLEVHVYEPSTLGERMQIYGMQRNLKAGSTAPDFCHVALCQGRAQPQRRLDPRSFVQVVVASIVIEYPPQTPARAEHGSANNLQRKQANDASASARSWSLARAEQ